MKKSDIVRGHASLFDWYSLFSRPPCFVRMRDDDDSDGPERTGPAVERVHPRPRLPGEGQAPMIHEDEEIPVIEKEFEYA